MKSTAMRAKTRLNRGASIAFEYAEARNMVFHKFAGRVAMSCHDENTKSK
jgi:hypothetical protein